MPFEVEAYAQVAGEEPMDFPVNPLALAKDMLALWEILWDVFSFLIVQWLYCMWFCLSDFECNVAEAINPCPQRAAFAMPSQKLQEGSMESLIEARSCLSCQD